MTAAWGFGQFHRRHGASSAAAELVHDVAPARAAEDAMEVCGRAAQQRRDPLAARQRLLLDIANCRHRRYDREDGVHGQAGPDRRRCVLEHQREGRALGHMREEARQAAGLASRRGGRHDHCRGCASFLAGPRLPCRLCGVGRAGADDHRHLAGDGLANRGERAGTLVAVQGFDLAGDAWIHHAVRARGDSVVGKPSQRREIDRVGACERRRENRKRSSEVRLPHPDHPCAGRVDRSRPQVAPSMRRRRRRATRPLQTDPDLWGFDAPGEQSVDSRLRGNDIFNANAVIPAQAGIHDSGQPESRSAPYAVA